MDSWLAAIIQSSNDAIISKTLDGTITSWNPAAERMFGFTYDEMINHSIRRIVPDRLQYEEDAIIAALSEGKRVHQFETSRLHKDGYEVTISVNVSPILDESGVVVGASKIARDITTEVATRKRLSDSEEWFHTLADNMSQLAWMADKTGWIFWYNKRWFDYTGATFEDMQGWGWTKVHHPDHLEKVVPRLQRSWDTGEPWEDTFPLKGADGKFRWFLSRALPIRDADGEIIRWFGTNTDITEERERQEQVRFLMREVAHRSKNMLALVQGIARQTGGRAHPEFLKKFGERLHALAACQDLLLMDGWRGTSVGELLESQLGHLKDLIGNRIFVEGPLVALEASAAQTLGMALHELSTNASKYGALSNETGEVRVQWNVVETGDEAGPALSISWTESGGPPVEVPEHRGFGSVVTERMCASVFSGEVKLEYRPEGVFWSLQGAPGRGLETDNSAPI